MRMSGNELIIAVTTHDWDAVSQSLVVTAKIRRVLLYYPIASDGGKRVCDRGVEKLYCHMAKSSLRPVIAVEVY